MSDISRDAVDAHAQRLLRFNMADTADEAHRRAAAMARQANNANEGRAPRSSDGYKKRQRGRRARIESTINNETGEVVHEEMTARDINSGDAEEWADARSDLK